MTGGVGQGENGGGVNPAAQENAHWHIADKVMSHAVEQSFTS